MTNPNDQEQREQTGGQPDSQSGTSNQMDPQGGGQHGTAGDATPEQPGGLKGHIGGQAGGTAGGQDSNSGSGSQGPQ